MYLSIQAQTPFVPEKRDYVWLTGYSSFTSDPLFGGARIDFNQSPPLVTEDLRELDLFANNSVVCDISGNLLFYNNGHNISSANHETLLNGSGINPNSTDNNFLWQASLSLPIPDHPDSYVLLHEESLGVDVLVTTLYSSYLSMEGGGEVTEKNIPIIQDTLSAGKITATRHANGRDWWILIGRFNDNIYYKLLLTPEGLDGPYSQEIGLAPITGTGRACFSPDGTKYAVYNGFLPEKEYLNVFDFNRCTGELTNPQFLHFQDGDDIAFFGQSVAFSPNSRYLYLNTHNVIFQYDLEAIDLFGSIDTVAVYDESIPPPNGWNTYMYHMQLAPDNKIYITTRGASFRYHIIHNPNEAGMNANFEQNALFLPTFNARTIPNNPNYRLGPLDGSPCDTLDIDNVMVNIEEQENEYLPTFTLFPNPSSGQVTLESMYSVGEKADLWLTDFSGRVLQRLDVVGNNSVEIDLDGLSNGIYICLVKDETGQIVYSEKLVVSR